MRYFLGFDEFTGLNGIGLNIGFSLQLVHGVEILLGPVVCRDFLYSFWDLEAESYSVVGGINIG